MMMVVIMRMIIIMMVAGIPGIEEELVIKIITIKMARIEQTKQWSQNWAHNPRRTALVAPFVPWIILRSSDDSGPWLSCLPMLHASRGQALDLGTLGPFFMPYGKTESGYSEPTGAVPS